MNFTSGCWASSFYPRIPSCLLPASPVLPLCERLLSISSGVLASSTSPENFDPQPQQGSSASLTSNAIHSLDDQLAFFLVTALFKTARCFFTLDLDLRGAGEDDGDIETLILSLETNVRHPLHKILQVSFIRIQVVVTVPSVGLEGEASHPSPQFEGSPLCTKYKIRGVCVFALFEELSTSM